MSLSNEERRVLGLAKLSGKDARLFIRLWLGSPENQDVLKRPASLRSAILKRQATKQTVIVQGPQIAATAEDTPELNPERSPIRPYDGKALPRRRWQSLLGEPDYFEHSSEVDPDELRKLIKAKLEGDNEADTALRRLACDLRKVGRPLPTKLAKFDAGRRRRRSKRGPNPTSQHLLRVLVFDLLRELQKRGIAPTQLGAVLVAEELRRQGVPSSQYAVIGIWKAGSRAIRAK